MTEVEAEMLKVVRATLVTGEARLFDHLATTFRWLTATLFAANGGAIIALLGWTDGKTHGGFAALGWFATGLILSILMGAFSAIASLLAIKPIETTRIAIDHSLITGAVPDKQTFQDLVARNKWSWKTWIPTYAGALSLLCLIGGMSVIACRL